MKGELDLYLQDILESQLANATKLSYKRFLTMLFTHFSSKDIFNKPQMVIDELIKKYSYLTVRNILISITGLYKHTKLLEKHSKNINVYRIKLIEMNKSIGESYNYDE